MTQKQSTKTHNAKKVKGEIDNSIIVVGDVSTPL